MRQHVQHVRVLVNSRWFDVSADREHQKQPDSRTYRRTDISLPAKWWTDERQPDKSPPNWFLVQFFFQIKHIFLQIQLKSLHYVLWDKLTFCFRSLFSQFCFIYLYFVKRTIRRCFFIVPGLMSHAESSDTAWDNVFCIKVMDIGFSSLANWLSLRIVKTPSLVVFLAGGLLSGFRRNAAASIMNEIRDRLRDAKSQ